VVPLKYLCEPSLHPGETMKRDCDNLTLFGSGDSAILRFYEWRSPAISLGRLQRAEEVLDLSLCEREGVSVLSRPTGGRQILHGEDISFSLIIPNSQLPFWGETVTARLATVGTHFCSALRSLGISAKMNSRSPERGLVRAGRKAPCFLMTTAGEITVQGKKLVGFAQLVRENSVLIQGTIPRTPFHKKVTYYELLDESKRNLRHSEMGEMTTSLAEISDQHSIRLNQFVDNFLNSLRDNYHFSTIEQF
jgi:lipoate-protein ligase A